VTGAAGAARPRISAAVICLDEERNIAACLESLAWCDEIVVVDSGSRDRTVEIARKHATRVLHHDWPGYVAQKNWALEQTGGEWVLCVDADERCTPALRAAIESALRADPPDAGFEVRRHVFYLGRWIDHGGWYPDWKLRLVRRGRARWGGVDPHDKLIADGPARRLDADLAHFTYENFASHLRTLQRFSDVVSEEQARAGRSFSLLRAITHPPTKFFECYVWKQGFRDGWPGFVIAATSAFYVFAKYVKLWERTIPRSEPEASGEVHQAGRSEPEASGEVHQAGRSEPQASGEIHQA
jgi:glycosyltransferase involved in cell wall biosynthesis